jgi:hypothetical protein
MPASRSRPKASAAPTRSSRPWRRRRAESVKLRRRSDDDRPSAL